MIEAVPGFVLGVTLCLALCLKRLRESRRAFKAVSKQNEMFQERERRYQETFGYLRTRIREIRNDLGGRALLPAPVEPTGQRFSYPLTRITAGLSANGGPGFSRREQ